MEGVTQTAGVQGVNDGLALAALVNGGKSSYGYEGMDVTQMGGICDLRMEVQGARIDIKQSESEIRRDVAKSESDIRLSIAGLSDNMHQSFCAVEKTLGEVKFGLSKEILDTKCELSKDILETKHSLAKDIMRSEYEGKLATAQAVKEVMTKVDLEAQRTNDKIADCCAETKATLCAFEKAVDQKFCDAREKSLEDQIAALRHDLSDKKGNGNN